MSNERDRIAFVIAVGLLAWGLAMIGMIAWRNRSLSEGGGEIFLAIAAGLVAALTAYFARGGNGGTK